MYVRSCLNQFVVYNSLWLLAHFAQLHDLSQDAQQRSTSSLGSGQQQVCHCNLNVTPAEAMIALCRYCF